ncbi:MAG TPA: hypothetical protein VMW30_03360 [Candidatus Paceibacterota bacterium]|nr:hypothetical protein [Candidatus Paceibacterota bacterium]
MSSKKKVITVAITSAALTLGTVGFATASQNRNSIKVKSAISNSIGFPGGMNVGMRGSGYANDELATVLKGLVAKGTLTQAQVDAITAAITAARAANQNDGVSDRATHQQLIADTLGISVATLQTRLAAGDSLATIAGAKTSALISALVAEATARIDAAVTAGKITAAQAADFKTNLTANVTAMVNRTGGMHSGMYGGMHTGIGVGIGMGRGFGDNDNDGRSMGMGTRFSTHGMGFRN